MTFLSAHNHVPAAWDDRQRIYTVKTSNQLKRNTIQQCTELNPAQPTTHSYRQGRKHPHRNFHFSIFAAAAVDRTDLINLLKHYCHISLYSTNEIKSTITLCFSHNSWEKTMTHFFFFFLVEIQIKCTQFEEGNLWYIMAHTSGAQSWAGSTCLCWCEESLTFPSAVMPISPFIHSLTRQAKAHYHPQITHKDTVLRQRFTLLATMRRISPFKHRIWAELAGQHARGWTFFFFFF